jgi:transcriptional regulator with XRE-family HTH domain
VNLLSDRIKKIIQEMDGKDHGKQSALAEIAGVSKAIVSHWTTGVTASMDYRNAKRLSDKLGYRLDWLMSGRGLAREDQSADVQPSRQTEEQPVVSSSAKPSNELFLTHVTADEMRLLTFCRTYPEAGKTIHRMATDLTGHPAMA